MSDAADDSRRRARSGSVDRDRLARAQRQGRRQRRDARTRPRGGARPRLQRRPGCPRARLAADATRRSRRRRQRRPPRPLADLLRQGPRGDLAAARAGRLRAAAARGRRRRSPIASTPPSLIGVDDDDPLIAELARAADPARRRRRAVPRRRAQRSSARITPAACAWRSPTCTRSATGGSRTSRARTNTAAGAERLGAFRREVERFGLELPDELRPRRRLLLRVRLPRDVRAARARRAADGDRRGVRPHGARRAAGDLGVGPTARSRRRRRRLRRPRGGRARAPAADDDQAGPPGARDARGDARDRARSSSPTRRRARAVVPVELVVRASSARGDR